MHVLVVYVGNQQLVLILLQFFWCWPLEILEFDIISLFLAFQGIRLWIYSYSTASHVTYVGIHCPLLNITVAC